MTAYKPDNDNESDVAVMEQEASPEDREKEPGQEEVLDAAEDVVDDFFRQLDQAARESQESESNDDTRQIDTDINRAAKEAQDKIEEVIEADPEIARKWVQRMSTMVRRRELKLPTWISKEKRSAQQQVDKRGHEGGAENKGSALPANVLRWEKAIASLDQDQLQIKKEFSIHHRTEERIYDGAANKKDNELRAELKKIDAELAKIHKEQETYKKGLSREMTKLRTDILLIEKEKGSDDARDGRIRAKENELRQLEQAQYYMEHGQLPLEKKKQAVREVEEIKPEKTAEEAPVAAGSEKHERKWSHEQVKRFQMEAEQISSPDDLRRMIPQADIEAAIADLSSKYSLHADGRVYKDVKPEDRAKHSDRSDTPDKFAASYWKDISERSDGLPDGFLRVKNKDGSWDLNALRVVATPIWAERQRKEQVIEPVIEGRKQDKKVEVVPAQKAPTEKTGVPGKVIEMKKGAGRASKERGEALHANVVTETNGGRLPKQLDLESAGKNASVPDVGIDEAAWDAIETSPENSVGALGELQKIADEFEENEQYRGAFPDDVPRFIRARNEFQERFADHLLYDRGTGKLKTSTHAAPHFWTWFGQGKKDYQEARLVVEHEVERWNEYEIRRAELQKQARDVLRGLKGAHLNSEQSTLLEHHLGRIRLVRTQEAVQSSVRPRTSKVSPRESMDMAA